MASRTDNTALAGQPEALEDYRRELTGYCYRMLGSGFEADDAVQETMLRAWRSSGQFEGRSSVRSWLYRIATNVCLDMLRGRQRRARPMELGPPSAPDEAFLGQMLPENMWVSPIADERVLPAGADPAEIVEARDTIRLAFVTALQHLPPKQRATLILCEVLRFQATEVAELLGTTVPAVNSALQRARATLAAVPADQRPEGVPEDHAELLNRYVDAFERYDMSALVGLLHEDALQSMPPFAMWVQGRGGHHHLDGAARAQRLPRLAPDPGAGQRLPGLRPVQARPQRRPRAVGAAGAGDLRGPDRADDDVPRHRRAVPGVRAARAPALASAVRFPGRSTPAPRPGS